MCIGIMNTDIFSHEFCYGGSPLHGTWALEAIVWAFSYGTKGCTDGTAFDSIWDVELISWQVDFMGVDLVTSWPRESWPHGNWLHESWLCERKSFHSIVPQLSSTRDTTVQCTYTTNIHIHSCTIETAPRAEVCRGFNEYHWLPT